MLVKKMRRFYKILTPEEAKDAEEFDDTDEEITGDEEIIIYTRATHYLALLGCATRLNDNFAKNFFLICGHHPTQ